jgi:hypothetical protein
VLARVLPVLALAAAVGCCFDLAHELSGNPIGPRCDPQVDEAHCEGNAVVGCAMHSSMDITPTMIGREDCADLVCVSDGHGHARCADPPGTPCDPTVYVAHCDGDGILACVEGPQSHPNPHGAITAVGRSRCDGRDVCRALARGPRCVMAEPSACASAPPAEDEPFCDGASVRTCVRDANGGWLTTGREDCARGETCIGEGAQAHCAAEGTTACDDDHDMPRCSDDGTLLLQCAIDRWRTSDCAAAGGRCMTMIGSETAICVREP